MSQTEPPEADWSGNVKLSALKVELRARRDAEGCEYVNASLLAGRLPYSNKEIGAALSHVEDYGWVEKFAYTRGTTYKITL